MAEKKQEEQKEKRQLTKVVEGSAEIKKKSKFEKVMEDFIVRDLKDIGYYIWKDVMVPGLKDAMADTINNTVGMMFWGDAGAYGGGRKRRKGEKEDYGRFSRSGGGRRRRDEDDDDDRPSRRRRDNQEYNNIELDSARDCKAVLDELEDQIEEFGQASIADLYALTGISSEFTDNHYGWYDMDGFDYVHVRGGWLLKVPKPKRLD